MKFERLRLENFKCFESVDVGLEAGVTVIHGLNGSGKSSLLEAGFFALYGARALDSTLDDVVTLGADETVVELWFTHGGQAFHVRRRLRVRESGTQTVECVLEGPAGTFEGATDVRARVTELLRMDETAFVNCAYVRQGEVNKLIEAAPAQRQDMIDDLLQLGRLEDYRDRASDARVGVGRVRDAKRERLAQLDEQIADKEDKDLQDRLNERQAALAEVTEEIAEYEEQRAAAVETLEAAEEVLETHEEHRAELAEVEATIDELRDTIATTERERDALADDLAELRTERSECVEKRDTLLAETELDPGEDDPTPAAVAERVEALEAERDDLRDRIEALSVEKTERESEATAAREAAADLAERAEEKRARATELAEEATESRATLSERRETLESLREEIAAIEADFEDAPVDIGEAATWVEELTAEIEALTDEIGTIEGTIESERAALEEAKDLRDAGKCPTCGQPVEGAPHVETIEADEEHVEALEADLAELQADRETLEDRRERATALRDREAERSRLRDRRDSLSELIEQAESTLDETEARVETLREEAAELETTATAKRESASEADAAAEEIREEIGTVNSTQTTLNERMATLEELRETCERVDELAGEIERVAERRESLAETNDERRERLREKRERKAELEDALADVSIEEATADRDRAEAYIEEVDETLAGRRERRDELQAAIGAIENELEALADLRERREDLAATVDRLESLYEEAEALEGLYGELRAELRRRNVDTLERMLNESFELIYENDSYSRIELDGDYRLTVYQKDGEPLRPDQLSGGERALFNLSLRSAIYRLLAEGIEGAAPMPPLILDEPTVFLDAGHVSRLVDLIEHMREIGVEQLLVVSHDEELVAAADDLLAVRKDATSNRSSVQRVDGTAPIPTPAD